MNHDPGSTGSVRDIVVFGTHRSLLFAALVFAAAIATRLSHLHAEPFYDEIYHLLAAESWWRDGTLALYEGEYARTPLYTILTAWMYELAGGPSVVAARAPNVLLGAGLAAGAALWTRHVAGSLAGWIVALLVLFWPSGIHLSQIVRFYALHGLLFFGGAVATYETFRPDLTPRRRLVMAGLAIAGFALAKQFQTSTLVGVLTLAVWAGAFVVLPDLWRRSHRTAILLAGGLAMAICVAIGFRTGILEALWTRYTYSPWPSDPTTYHRVLRESYPLLWTVTPLLSLFALWKNWRPASFCVTLTVLGIALHSFAAQQNIRYIYYLTPFLFALWAMGLQAILPQVLAASRRAASALFGRHAPMFGGSALVALALIFAVFANAAATRGIKLIMGRVAPPFHLAESWAPARQPVADLVDEGAIVVATNDLAAIYYLGGFDVGFSENWLQSMNRTEFAIDPRTGRPMISLSRSLAELARTYPRGVVLTTGDDRVMQALRAIAAGDIAWTASFAGPVTMLSWRSDGTSPPAGSARIRAAVGRE